MDWNTVFVKQTMILSNYDGSIIWQCYLAIGLTLVLLAFIYGPHIAYFEVLFSCWCLPKKCTVTAQYYSLFLLCKWYIFINFAKKTYQLVSFLCILHNIPKNGYFAIFPFILCLKNYEKSQIFRFHIS